MIESYWADVSYVSTNGREFVKTYHKCEDTDFSPEGRCKNCDFEYDDSYGIPAHYCPRCGAKMINGFVLKCEKERYGGIA